jgi:hypothetical protein
VRHPYVDIGSDLDTSSETVETSSFYLSQSRCCKSACTFDVALLSWIGEDSTQI